MYRRNLLLVSTLAFTGLISACEDDYSRGPKNGVPDASLLSGLSTAQVAVFPQFDGYTAQYSRVIDHIGCTVAALMFGGKGAACEKYRSECLPPAPMPAATPMPAANCDTPAAQAPLWLPLRVGVPGLPRRVARRSAIDDEAATCQSNAADVPNYTALSAESCQVVRDKYQNYCRIEPFSARFCASGLGRLETQRAASARARPAHSRVQRGNRIEDRLLSCRSDIAWRLVRRG